MKLLHFADAHIDMNNYGRHDREKALPVRVVDYLEALDQIVDAAIEEKVDIVLFAGDAYKDRNPQPTFQREWGRRMMRLSDAKIPTLLLVGNHDVSPASGRAHTLHEFRTLEVPHIHVADRLHRFGPDELGVPLQIIAIPWLSRSQMLTREEMHGKSMTDILLEMEKRLTDVVNRLIDDADPNLPLVLTAHASVEGARYGSERQVMLGQELLLGRRLVQDKRLDYVALGHIHKHQSLNGDAHPPIVYSGSIERVDFGEIREKKGFILVDIEKGKTNWHFIRLQTRRFLDFAPEGREEATFMADILDQLPEPEAVSDAICRVTLSYPREWEALLDERAIYDRFEQALEVRLVKQYILKDRIRLGDTVAFKALSPLELLETYWGTKGYDEEQTAALQELAKEILND